MELVVEYDDAGEWREWSLPDTLGTATRHARAQAAHVQGKARVRDRSTGAVPVLYGWNAATHRPYRVR